VAPTVCIFINLNRKSGNDFFPQSPIAFAVYNISVVESRIRIIEHSLESQQYLQMVLVLGPPKLLTLKEQDRSALCFKVKFVKFVVSGEMDWNRLSANGRICCPSYTSELRRTFGNIEIDATESDIDVLF